MVVGFGPLESAWGTRFDDALDAEREARRERAARWVRRSNLILPVNVPRFVAKAHLRGADAITLDLEDSIPPDEKGRAREQVREAIPLVGRGGADVFVRINHPFPLALEDLSAAVRPGLTGISFPKAESAQEIQALDRLLTERELAAGMPPGGVQLAVALENARGLFNAVAIATASPRIAGIGFGQEDATLELGVEPSREGKERLYGNTYVIMVAALAGIQAWGLLGNFVDYSDPDAYAQVIREARRIGFKGSSCIHPSQVEILNREFSPDAADVEHARQVIATYEAAQARGRASASLDDKMVDIPTYRRAQRLLERAEAIQAKEAAKRSALATAEP